MSAFLLLGSNAILQAQTSDASPTIPEVAMSADGFNQLVGALKKAELVTALQGEGPFTVFAPEDAAFEAISETVASLDQDALTTVLKYHVVSGKFMAKDVVKAIQANDGSFEIQTLSGNKLVAMLKGDNVVLKDANGNISTVVAADVKASNGVIHVVNKVLLP